MKKLALSLTLLSVPVLAQDEIRYSYDKNGRLTRVEYPNGRAIAYTYDPSGNLVRREFIAPPPPAAENRQSPPDKSPRNSAKKPKPSANK